MLMNNFKLPKDLIISISGIRGKIPGNLTSEICYQLTRAFADIAPDGPMILSRDTRKSGLEIKNAVICALADAGRKILDIDVAPLPTTQVGILFTNCAGAIDITASHNPKEYNGLKFLGPDGLFISQQVLDDLIDKSYCVFSKNNLQPNIVNIQNKIFAHHINLLKENTFTDGRKLIVAVDAVNGAGSIIIPKLLRELNCEVIEIATDPDSEFPHTPEPTPTNLAWTQEKLKNKMFDFGVVVDPDADRLVLIDEKNNILSEETTLPLVLQELIEQGRRGKVVVNMSTSRMIEDIASQNNCLVFRSEVGEVNVINLMKKQNAFFGGEGNGGIIDPKIHFGRDSLVGISYIINSLRRTNKTLSQLVGDLPHYEMKKEKVDNVGKSKLLDIYPKIEDSFPGGVVNKEDGLRIDFGKSWVHIRPSNTEPIVRVIAEAPTISEVESILNITNTFLK